MARKKNSPQKAALRELMGNYLKENNVKVKDGTDVNSIMRDMMSIILEGALDQELDEELGYSKYDYRCSLLLIFLRFQCSLQNHTPPFGSPFSSHLYSGIRNDNLFFQF